MRLAALLVALAAAVPVPAAPAPKPPVVEAVEFPYYLYPRQLWERELVWLKTIGVRTVEFSIPWNWHQSQPGEFDFTGRTSPRRDLAGFIRLLRRLELRAWVRPLPPVPNWPRDGAPEFADAALRRAWLKQLDRLLATQTARHGGPVEFVEGRALAIDAAAPPSPVAVISAGDPAALSAARAALAGSRGALLWTGVEDALYPEGWSPNAGSLLRHGAVGLSGDERSAATALRRDAALLRNWAPLLPALKPVAMPKPLAGKLPEGVTAVELVSPAASAVSITNLGKQLFHDDLRVFEPFSRRVLVIPAVTVRPGDSLWLPVSVSIGPDGLCRECSNFSGAEHIVYATAELLDIEFENGILAMEFAAPEPAEVILQLARKPVGPFLAAGKPIEFDWDDKTLRARLKIPASTEAGNRVRIGIAIEEPETSAFFNDAHRLIIGRKNVVSTTYSSPDVAKRSRLLLPEGFTSSATVKSPNEIEYQVGVPSDELHGDYADLALEADGMPLGRARLQLFRPASIRLADAIEMHFGPNTVLVPDPPTAPIDPKAGTNLEISIRNNTPAIQTYHLQPVADGLDFFPPQTDISIGAIAERRVSFRVFAQGPRRRTPRLASPRHRRRRPRPPHARHPHPPRQNRRLDRRSGQRRHPRVDPRIRAHPRRLFPAGWRPLDGVHLEGHQRQLPSRPWRLRRPRPRRSHRRRRFARVHRSRLEAYRNPIRQRAHDRPDHASPSRSPVPRKARQRHPDHRPPHPHPLHLHPALTTVRPCL